MDLPEFFEILRQAGIKYAKGDIHINGFNAFWQLENGYTTERERKRSYKSRGYRALAFERQV